MDKRFRKALREVKGYVVSDKKILRRVLLSLISLAIVISLFVTSSFSWFSVIVSTVEADNFKLDCGKGLRVNDSGTSQMQFSQVDKWLIPASSVDGRNLYFPTDGSDFSDITAMMTFRSANAGDKNQNYIQIDFSLTAQQNHTALYINEEKTSIKVRSGNEDWSGSQAAALRSALWSSTAESGVPNTPIVFNPTNSVLRTAAVADVDRSTGAFIASGRQVAHPFSDYSFGGTPVATLSKGVETKFSYIIWLEGTDPKCNNNILNKNIQVNLAFTTSWDKTQTIRFKDNTTNNWVTTLLTRSTDKYTLSLHYNEVNEHGQETSSYTDFNMYAINPSADNHVWTCNIPGDMRKNISFILRPPSGSSDAPTYIFRYDSRTGHAGETTLDRGANRLYVAEGSEADPTSNCTGYWMEIGDSDGSGHDGGSFDGDDF